MDYKKEHTVQKAAKNPVSSKPGSGTSAIPNHKQHERTIALGEGLEMGSVHTSHTKNPAMDAKDNRAPHAASHAQRNRVISGKSNTMGEGSVGNQETGHASYHKPNQPVIKSSREQRESAIAGNANPEGEQPMVAHHNNTPKNLK